MKIGPSPPQLRIYLLLLVLVAGCVPTHLLNIEESVPSTWPYHLDATPARGTHVMVASDAPLATEVGVSVLRAGGTAADAAIAAAFALAVVFPEAGNIGGGGFVVAHFADRGAATLDFRETAPRAADPDMFLDSLGNPTDRSTVGHLACGIPGTVAGLWACHQRYGLLPWADLVAPAIHLAENGFPLDERFAAVVSRDSALLARFPSSARLFLPGGRPPPTGFIWTNHDLAATLQRISAHGPKGFYEGETADHIVREMQRGGGLITHGDLAAYTPKWRAPVEFKYRGYTIISMPPPSSGGITLGLIANIMAGYDLSVMRWGSVPHLHRTAEAMRRAFAIRNRYLGDPDFVYVPESFFVSQGYADFLRLSIEPGRATPSHEISLGSPPAESAHTTHISVVDSAGNAVALTTTVNGLFGSGVTVEGSGFLLNNEMDDFTLKPGVPNSSGLVQHNANSIEPGKRMLSSMTPTIALDSDGHPFLVTGARGGPMIITAVYQVLSNVIDHEIDIAMAVRLPRIHHQHLPDTLRYEENGFLPQRLEALQQMGHATRSSSTIGVAPSIQYLDGQWLGTADPRVPGLAKGF